MNKARNCIFKKQTDALYLWHEMYLIGEVKVEENCQTYNDECSSNDNESKIIYLEAQIRNTLFLAKLRLGFPITPAGVIDKCWGSSCTSTSTRS